jgi:hypothetical protein
MGEIDEHRGARTFSTLPSGKLVLNHSRAVLSFLVFGGLVVLLMVGYLASEGPIPISGRVISAKTGHPITDAYL